MKPVTSAEFNTATTELLTRASKNWTQKNACYSLDESGGDTLRNINVIADMLEISPEKVVMIYMTKHYLALMSSIERADDGGEELLERLSDVVNYLKMLAAFHYWGCDHEPKVGNL